MSVKTRFVVPFTPQPISKLLFFKFSPHSSLLKSSPSAPTFLAYLLKCLRVCRNRKPHTLTHTRARTHRCGRFGFAPRSSSSGYISHEPSGAGRWWRSPDELLRPENKIQLSYLQESRHMWTSWLSFARSLMELWCQTVQHLWGGSDLEVKCSLLNKHQQQT